ncbi:MAG: TonB-dependent receptor [Alphaproteobacteria bacterium]|nr:TonB-dependent receptor [Alphaproteobacteria bacterium]
MKALSGNALTSGASLLVLAAMTALPAAASAQTAPAPTSGDSGSSAATADSNDAADSDIIVTGTRQALKTSQNIKRNADTLVDSITATDIGAFPDKSVAEALQRVPGITVNRFAASDDTSHFSADPSGVIVRGLTQVRSEFNGRDTFSANSSRGLSWEDISPELMAGVDTYKNATAELIEGGIAGSINLRTRLPFDSNKQVIQASLNLDYGDLSKKATPEFSALYSDRWTTGIGDIGILVDGAYSKVETESQGVVYGRTAVFSGVYGPGMQYIPSSVGYRDTVYDRTRKGVAAALQWRDPTGRISATAQYDRSQFHETWRERGVISYLTDLYAFPANFVFTNGGANASHIPRPAPGTPAFTFDSDGNFETGMLVNQQTDFSWWGASDAESAQLALNDRGQNMLHPCYNWGPGPIGACGADARGPDLNAVTRFNDSHRMTQDASFNLKWNATDRLDLNFDAQYVDAKVRNYDVEVGQYSFANVALDTSGAIPRMTFSTPTNINQSAGALTNPDNYRYNHAMDHVEDDKGTEWAFRADANYRFETPWLDSLKVGLRYSDRDQDVRYSAYNWGNIVNDWNLGSGQSAYWNIDRHAASGAFKGYPQGLSEVHDLGGSFFGGSSQYVFFDMNKLANHGIDQLSYSNLGVGQDQWEPICSNGGTAHTGPRTGEIAGTCFRPDELNTVSETTKAAYAMLRFGGRDARIGGMSFAGNIGVRYVETRDKVSGSTVFPAAFSSTTLDCRNQTVTPGAPPPAIPRTIGCYLQASPSVLAFNNGGASASAIETTHHNWLPSLNLRLDLSSKWLLRFAASRALSRPDIGLLKNYRTISAQLPGDDPSDPRYVKNAAGVIVGVNPLYQASGYNPSLKPITATQFDLSLENYFANVGSFTAAVFYKKFQNYIQYASHFENFTNNGVTNSIEVRGPENGKGGSVHGAEVSYQRFFDFLPGALSGFGVQLNGTYVKNHGIQNSGLKNQNGTDGGSQAQGGSAGTTLSVNSLEGLSKYSYNLVGMYEKYGLAVRVAYNWRSRFLITAVDCCTYLPTWQRSAGFLDASIRYAVNDHIELSVQGSNLLNTITKLEEQVTSAENGSVLTPNAWFRNDRRFVLGARVKF